MSASAMDLLKTSCDREENDSISVAAATSPLDSRMRDARTDGVQSMGRALEAMILSASASAAPSASRASMAETRIAGCRVPSWDDIPSTTPCLPSFFLTRPSRVPPPLMDFHKRFSDCVWRTGRPVMNGYHTVRRYRVGSGCLERD